MALIHNSNTGKYQNIKALSCINALPANRNNSKTPHRLSVFPLKLSCIKTALWFNVHKPRVYMGSYGFYGNTLKLF